MKSKDKLKIAKVLTLIALCCIIFLLFSIYSGLNELKSIEIKHLSIASEQRDTLNAQNCYMFNDDIIAFNKCMDSSDDWSNVITNENN